MNTCSLKSFKTSSCSVSFKTHIWSHFAFAPGWVAALGNWTAGRYRMEFRLPQLCGVLEKAGQQGEGRRRKGIFTVAATLVGISVAFLLESPMLFGHDPLVQALAVGEISQRTGIRPWAAAWGKFSQQANMSCHFGGIWGSPLNLSLKHEILGNQDVAVCLIQSWLHR